MNHWDSFHWRSYHFASNHFWGTGAPPPVVVGLGSGWALDFDLEDVKRKARQVENNERAALLVAIAEADDL